MGVFGHVIRELSRPLWSASTYTARPIHRFIKAAEPWGIGIAVMGFGLSALMLVIDLEDRQAERTFRAWEVVLSAQDNPNGGNSIKLALEYLNRQYTPPAWMCGEGIRLISESLTGNWTRTCFIPKKDRASFSAAKFPNVRLRGVNLMEADLTSTKLSGADLREAHLMKANLSLAYLAGAKLSKANLSGASLRLATLTGSVLDKADLHGVDLLGANLTATHLKGANLREANLREADLREANLEGASLFEANLSDASLKGTNIVQSQLDEACTHPEHPPQNIPTGLKWTGRLCSLEKFPWRTWSFK